MSKREPGPRAIVREVLRSTSPKWKPEPTVANSVSPEHVRLVRDRNERMKLTTLNFLKTDLPLPSGMPAGGGRRATSLDDEPAAQLRLPDGSRFVVRLVHDEYSGWIAATIEGLGARHARETREQREEAAAAAPQRPAHRAKKKTPQVAAKRRTPNGPRRARYLRISVLPRKVPDGRVLVHNHMSHEVDTLVGTMGFRAWTQASTENLAKCSCGWAGLPHYRVRVRGV